MHKAMTALVLALGLVALASGTAYAGGGCGSYQSVENETVTASADGHSGSAPYTPAPESKTN
jgi:hypothetical protein